MLSVSTPLLRFVVGWFGCLVAVLGALAGAGPASAQGPGSDAEVRALWVTRGTLASPESVSQMVLAARAGGFNTLLVQVRGRGDAYYTSTLEPRAAELAGRPDFDPLAQVIAQARPAGIQVHAWLAVNLVSSAATLPSSRNHILYRNPEWLMVPKALAVELRGVDVRSPEYVGRLARWSRANNTAVEGLYVSPVHPGAAGHIAAVARELVSTYDLDGVHLDYVRYPGDGFDFSRAALDQFRQSMETELPAEARARAAARERLDPFAYPNLYPERWDAFRRSRLTSLVMRVRTAVKQVRPDVTLSAAVVADAREAYESRLQDWRTWLDQSLIDVLCPMAYTTDARQFDTQIRLATDYAAGRPVWAGIGAYRLSVADTSRFIAAARRQGAAGTVLFSYDALTTPPHTASTLTALGRAAFGDGSQ